MKGVLGIKCEEKMGRKQLKAARKKRKHTLSTKIICDAIEEEAVNVDDDEESSHNLEVDDGCITNKVVSACDGLVQGAGCESSDDYVVVENVGLL